MADVLVDHAQVEHILPRARRMNGALLPVPVQVVIASGVRLVREGLAASLTGRDGIELLRTVDLDQAGIAAVAAAQPDVVVLDLAGIDSVAVARALRQAAPRSKLIAFAVSEQDDHVFACAAAGFSGYVPRDCGADELHRALLDMTDGRMSCAPHIAAAMFNRLSDLLHRSAPRAALETLTARENEVLAMAEAGRSNKEIARSLSISGATVKNHMHSIFRKLGVSSRGQAVALIRSKRGN